MRKRLILFAFILLLASLVLHSCTNEIKTPDLLPQSDNCMEVSDPENRGTNDEPQVPPDFSGYDAGFITSPANGEMAAACITANGNSYLVIRQQDNATGNVSYTPVCVYPNEEDKISNLKWSPDGVRIAFLEQESSDGMGQYCKVSVFDPAKSIKCDARMFWLDETPSPTVEWFPDSDRLLIASRPVVIFTCSTGKSIWVSQDTPAQNEDFAADEIAKSMDASLSPGGHYIAYELIGDKCIYLMLYDVDTQKRCEWGKVATLHEMGVGSQKPVWVSDSSVKWYDKIYNR